MHERYLKSKSFHKSFAQGHTLSTHTVMAEGIITRVLLPFLTKDPSWHFLGKAVALNGFGSQAQPLNNSETVVAISQSHFRHRKQARYSIGGTLLLGVIFCHSDECRQNYRSPYKLLVCPISGILLIPLNFKEFSMSELFPLLFYPLSRTKKKISSLPKL